jgi:Kef-type K+ transport system membrane component KefB
LIALARTKDPSLPDVVQTLAAHQLLQFLLGVVILLVLAVLFGRIAARLGMPAIAGELLVGVLLGPSLLAHLAPGMYSWLFTGRPEQFHLLDAVGQLSVLLLVGLTGAHMDIGHARRHGSTLAYISASGLLIPFALGFGLALLLPESMVPFGTERWVFCLFLGTAMCVSAIPVIAKILSDLNMLHRKVGQLTLAAGVIDDMFGWLMLSVVSLAATTGVAASGIGVQALVLVVGVPVVLVVLRPALRALLAKVARTGRSDVMMATVVGLILLGASGTLALDMEAVIGAFLMGLLISSTGQVRAAAVAPLRTFVLAVLAPVFFAMAGLRMDLTALADPTVAVVAAAVLVTAVAGKFIGVFAGARLGRLNRWEALAIGAGMNARGVIEVIVATAGLRLGVIGIEVYTMVVLVAVATSLMAPPILRFAVARLEPTREEELRRSRMAEPQLL